MASLIGFDKNRKNVEFKGHSKLSINFMSNYLYVEPENEAFKLISASFQWNFIMKKNLLFVFAEFKFLDFCLVFKNEQVCKKIFDYIASGKTNDATSPDVLIDASFIRPIFQAISINQNLNSNLIETIVTWHQLLDVDEKEKYSNMMKDYGIHDLIIAAVPIQQNSVNVTNVKGNRKRKFAEIKQEELDNREEIQIPSTFTKIIPSSQFELLYTLNARMRKMIIFIDDTKSAFHIFRCRYSMLRNTKFQCAECRSDCVAIIDVNADEQICVKMEDKKHSCQVSTKIPENYSAIKIIQKPGYEFHKNCTGIFKTVLTIFDSTDRTQCYEYFWRGSHDKFVCGGCQKIKTKPSLKAKAEILNEGTSKEFVGIINENHICLQKRKYCPEKYRQHFNYVLKPNFEIQKFRHAGKKSHRLLIFDQNDKTKCYQYSKISEIFQCHECEKMGKHVSAKLRRNVDNVEYVILSNVEHVCEMITYVPKITLHQHDDFELMEEIKDGKSKIFVFVENDKINCYVFAPVFADRSLHYCRGCENVKLAKRRLKIKASGDKRFSGNLYKNEDTGKYTFEMKSNQRHICEPKKYEPHNYEILSKSYDFFYFYKKGYPNALKVAIVSPESPKLCYSLNYHKSRKLFSCWECTKMSKYVTAKLLKDANGKECFDHDSKKHICKPLKVSSISPPKFIKLKEHGLAFESKSKIKIDESKIIKKPDFELHPNTLGIADRKLIVLHTTDKTLCFEYFFDAIHNNFKCSKCQSKKKHVYARLHKNDDEECIERGKNEHVCQPIQYSSISESRSKDNKESKIIRMPNFELLPGKRNGAPDGRLIILHPTDKTLFFEYSFDPNQQRFECTKCHVKKHYVTAKLHKNGENTDESFIVLGKNEHVCKPQNAPLPILESEIVKMPNFELRPNKDGIPDKTLIIFHPDDKTLCYQYCYDCPQQFKCSKCHHKKIHVTAKLEKDETNGEPYIILGKTEHVCQPAGIPAKYSDPKYVRKPMFELHPNRFGAADKKLIILHPNDKTMCYVFSFDKSKQLFKCTKCNVKNKSVSAKLQKDQKNGEEFVAMGIIDHVCKPVKYQPPPKVI